MSGESENTSNVFGSKLAIQVGSKKAFLLRKGLLIADKPYDFAFKIEIFCLFEE
jgi:hypothetical protein